MAHGVNMLVDCGITQGNDQAVPMEAWPVAPAEIDFLFLIHAHVDQVGRGLLADGDHPLKFDHLYAVRSYRDHQRVLGARGPGRSDKMGRGGGTETDQAGARGGGGQGGTGGATITCQINRYTVPGIGPRNWTSPELDCPRNWTPGIPGKALIFSKISIFLKE